MKAPFGVLFLYLWSGPAGDPRWLRKTLPQGLSLDAKWRSMRRPLAYEPARQPWPHPSLAHRHLKETVERRFFFTLQALSPYQLRQIHRPHQTYCSAGQPQSLTLLLAAIQTKTR